MTATGPAERVQFPALDPEPPPRSWRWRLGATGAFLALLAVAGGLVWLGVSLSGPSHPKPKASTVVGGALPGQVAFLSTAGMFGVATADGGAVTPLPSLGAHALSAATYALPSLDGRFLIAGDGTVLSARGSTLAVRSHRLDMAAHATEELANVEPFADHDHDVVILSGGYVGYLLTDAPVSVVDWATGAPVANLGTADASAGAAGDPQAPGAFVSVAFPASSRGEADSAVELRDAGRPPVVLASAAGVDRALRLAPTRSFVLAAYPDPAGDKVAITVNINASGTGPSIGMIVVDRRGRLLSSLTGPSVPQAGYGVTWSPDGSKLLYIAAGANGEQVVEWAPGSGAPPSGRPLPDIADTAGNCLWSPNGSAVLCETNDLNTQTVSWVSGPARGGALRVASGPGNPVEWLGAAP